MGRHRHTGIPNSERAGLRVSDEESLIFPVAVFGCVRGWLAPVTGRDAIPPEP